MCGKSVGFGLCPSEVTKSSFFGHFWANLAEFLTSKPYDFDAIAHIGFYNKETQTGMFHSTRTPTTYISKLLFLMRNLGIIILS